MRSKSWTSTNWRQHGRPFLELVGTALSWWTLRDFGCQCGSWLTVTWTNFGQLLASCFLSSHKFIFHTSLGLILPPPRCADFKWNPAISASFIIFHISQHVILHPPSCVDIPFWLGFASISSEIPSSPPKKNLCQRCVHFDKFENKKSEDFKWNLPIFPAQDDARLRRCVDFGPREKMRRFRCDQLAGHSIEAACCFTESARLFMGF